MRLRPLAHTVGLVLALGTLGCVDRNYDTTDLSGKLEVTPLYYATDEGFPAVQFAATIDGAPVAVTWESSAPLVASVSAGGLVTPIDSGFAAITATVTANTSTRKSASFTVNPLFGTPVFNGVAVAGIGGTAGTQALLYRVFVPEGASNLTVTMTGGTGDLDLIVRHAQVPNYDDYDCYSYLGGATNNDESCSFDDPAFGTWYIFVDVWTTGGGASITATVTAP